MNIVPCFSVSSWRKTRELSMKEWFVAAPYEKDASSLFYCWTEAGDLVVVSVSYSLSELQPPDVFTELNTDTNTSLSLVSSPDR